DYAQIAFVSAKEGTRLRTLLRHATGDTRHTGDR
ncbi:hypothetical protein SS7213T_02478, partial [Staphylococcus simiae CCM 7213 = CCUG 51256]